MKRKPYASEVTKDYLKKLGVEFVSTNGATVIVNGKVAKFSCSHSNKRPYKNISFYDPDIRAATPKEERTNTTGQILLGAHVLNYVWNKEDKPSGMVIDHIDNDSTNNDISNLQCITVSENLAKEKPNWHTSELKCKLNKPRDFYEEKLAKYEALYEEAKANSDAELAHSLRTNIAQTRARLRYYDNHLEEAKSLQLTKEVESIQKREYHERAQMRRLLKAKVDSARKYYKEVCKAYGKDDEIVRKYWGEWKLAIAMYQGFCAETKVEC